MLKLENEIHIFKLPNPTTIQTIQQLVTDNFRQWPPAFHFTYVDAEGDVIDVTNDDDLSAVLELEGIEELRRKNVVVKLGIKEEER